MQELEQLIQKFWNKETTQEENRRLTELLKQYPETYRIGIAEQFHKQAQLSLNGLEKEKADRLLSRIQQNLEIEQKTIRLIPYKKWAAAAATLIIVASLFLLIRPHHQKAAQPPIARLVHLTSAHDSVMTLEDGSTVHLGKNSDLSFYQPFTNNRRDLWLEGNATFTVAKDKTRPFTVFAGGTATRALGTRFSINTADSGKVKVRLLEGKIVVSPIPGSGLVMKDLYLNPGQELSLDRQSRLYALGSPKTAPAAKIPSATKPHPHENRSDLAFAKEPLGSVFEKIGHLYKVSLIYRPEEVKDLYFTGTFLQSDDLHMILSAICNVNNLAFSEGKDSILITRSH